MYLCIKALFSIIWAMTCNKTYWIENHLEKSILAPSKDFKCVRLYEVTKSLIFSSGKSFDISSFCFERESIFQRE